MANNLEGLIALGAIIIPMFLLLTYFVYDQGKLNEERKKKKS